MAHNVPAFPNFRPGAGRALHGTWQGES